MGNATITKIARLSDKLSRSELNELEQQTQTKFIFKGVCGEIDFYANCSDVFKIKYKRSGTQYLIKGLEVSENEFYKTYNNIWCILKNNNNIEFSQITEWDSQSDLEAPYKYNMIPCAIKTFVIDEYAFKDGKVIYHDIELNKHEATVNSSFYHEIDSIQATGKYGAIVSATPVSHTYKIDGNCVDRDTFNEVINLFKGANSTADFDMSFDNLTHIDKPIKIVFEGEPTKADKLREKLQQQIINNFNLQTTSDRQKLFNIVEDIIDRYNRMGTSPLISLRNNVTHKFMEHINSKENENMPKIVNYKYNEETGTTTLFWADKTQTTVTADNLTEANQFEGFCAACAKKLFGNKSTYLNQFDKWTVKKPEQERKKAEAEKAKAEEQAKIKAERAEKAKEKEVKRLAKLWANQYKRENERIEIAKAAEKIAKDKYGIPYEYFERLDNCCEDCCEDCGCHNTHENTVIDNAESTQSEF